jgi:hypothetical protein
LAGQGAADFFEICTADPKNFKKFLGQKGGPADARTPQQMPKIKDFGPTTGHLQSRCPNLWTGQNKFSFSRKNILKKYFYFSTYRENCPFSSRFAGKPLLFPGKIPPFLRHPSISDTAYAKKISIFPKTFNRHFNLNLHYIFPPKLAHQI